MNLYLVVHDDRDGDNFDLLVWALTSQQAKDLWRKRVSPFLAPEDVQAFLIPTQPPATPKALRWFADVRLVEEEPKL